MKKVSVAGVYHESGPGCQGGYMEEQIARIESLLEQMDKALDRIERGIVGVQTEVLKVGDRAEELEDKIDANFRWTIGVMITMWVTIILAILLRS